ncbi:transposon Ty3-I Gag-Pol polyprotein [Trichonephila inaurata madagascariensis]|uniref:RNA-directed DNA polymerase n=1 Tax=Trichonephila inaurata madagascariensis TaxID=2747483 RepID=A0A8X6JAQ5_9ARAC|nr:transposon Ty3-I Gag-Pol polyprotein [Trichonephila inaurata madagascariensis]
MDMHSGYWQIEVDEADREKTAFITSDGLYEFNAMPFGSFLGLCSYHRRFIKNFCFRAKPLQQLLKGDSKFHWEKAQEDLFRDLKSALTSPPVLALYDENSPTELHTDTSGYGIGAVLVKEQDGKERVIAYASRTN